VLRIRSDFDVEAWKSTSAYKYYGTFLRQLNESVVGYSLPLEDGASDSEAVSKMLLLLDELDSWIDNIPPQPTPQRFGNLAFRDYGRRLHERSADVLRKFLPTSLHSAVPLLLPYFETSFGSFQRIDYGTGHETSFALFLCCLTLLRVFQPEPEEERRLVLRIFQRYMILVWRLQDVYRLEPAGSHGVWGLDDYGFLGYYFGSGQIRDRQDISPEVILHPPLPVTNLYFMSIMRIHQLKHGPFHEHSSQLFSIARGVAKWSKVNSGMLKMYEAEVLSKRVVVQHIPLGGLLPWDPPAPSAFSLLPPSRNPAPWASSVPSQTHTGSGLSRPSTGYSMAVPLTTAPWATQRITAKNQSDMPPSSTSPQR